MTASKASSSVLLVLLLYFAVNTGFDVDNCKIPFKNYDKAREVPESMYLIDLSIKNTTHGLATTYFPDTQYDIIIRPKSITLTFKEFHFRMINFNRSLSYGTLELRDPELSKFDTNDYCMDRIVNLATPNKPNITIGWQSPPTKSGCLKLTAYIKETDLRYHVAELTACEDPRVELDNPGEILRNCCACELAKYEMTFEGMWTPYTHPRGFPMKHYTANFPTVVGAAHDAHYRIWQVYTNASEGLKTFAETGYSIPLELELKAQRDNITTFIKFRGTNFKNQTLARAQLRVDRKNHVISLVGRINPSPDWFIGVSSLELCKPDCTWMENKTLNLYAYDVGSKAGLGFGDENTEYTHDVINRMNMSWPLPMGNRTSPFYDATNNTHEVRPMAQIYLRRIRTYGSTCNVVKEEPKRNEDCVGEWEVLDCSVTCGWGVKLSRRDYLEGYNATNCDAITEKREKCGDSTIKCEEPINEETCQLDNWGEWERCAKSCGPENVKRERRYKIEPDKCDEKYPGKLKEWKDCGHPPCPNDYEINCDDSSYTPWSAWGPCSVTVGKGLQYHHREVKLKIADRELQEIGFAKCLYHYRPCEGVDPASITEAPLPDSDSVPVERYPDDRQRPAGSTKPSECLLALDEGYSCNGADEVSRKWAYDKDTNRCEDFGYLGCGGNDNRFDLQSECHATCIDGEVIECEMSEWTAWSECQSCQDEQIRTRYVKVEPSPSAKPCPVANRQETRPCRLMRQCRLN